MYRDIPESSSGDKLLSKVSKNGINNVRPKPSARLTKIFKMKCLLLPLLSALALPFHVDNLYRL